MDPRKEPKAINAAPMEMIIDVLIDNDDPTKVLKVESQPSLKMKKELVEFLRLKCVGYRMKCVTH